MCKALGEVFASMFMCSLNLLLHLDGLKTHTHNMKRMTSIYSSAFFKTGANYKKNLVVNKFVVYYIFKSYYRHSM